MSWHCVCTMHSSAHHTQRPESIHNQDCLKETCLTSASILLEHDIIPILIKHGADPNHRQNMGRTPLMAAFERPRDNRDRSEADLIKTLRALLEGGAVRDSRLACLGACLHCSVLFLYSCTVVVIIIIIIAMSSSFIMAYATNRT